MILDRDPLDRLRVLTINLWNKQGPWERRRELLIAGIAALQPDVIGLQEVLRHATLNEDQATDLANALGLPYVAFATAWAIGGGLDFGNAVISRFPIAARGDWLLPSIPGEETRGLLHTGIDTPFGELPFFVTHLAWRLHQGALRQRQVAFIAERVAEQSTRDKLPAVLVGDFNAEPDSDEMRFLRGHHAIEGKTVAYNDCFRFCWPHGEPGFTFARRNPFALRAHEPDRRLDYVLARLPDYELRGEPLACRVVLDEADEHGVFPSDHFGVYAELAAAPRKLE